MKVFIPIFILLSTIMNETFTDHLIFLIYWLFGTGKRTHTLRQRSPSVPSVTFFIKGFEAFIANLSLMRKSQRGCAPSISLSLLSMPRYMTAERSAFWQQRYSPTCSTKVPQIFQRKNQVRSFNNGYHSD